LRADWRIRTLGELSNIAYGYTAKAAAEPIGPKLLRITDIQNNSVDWDNVPYCKIVEEEHKKHKLITGDIVFARTGATTGKSYMVSSPPDAVCASYLIRLRLRSSELLPRFVRYYFDTRAYWDAVSTGISGSAQGGFNASKLGALRVPLPPLHEQERTVTILDEAFAGLTIATANAEKNLKNARELFESYLQAVFDQTKPLRVADSGQEGSSNWQGAAKLDDTDSTRTGGRAPSTRHIEGRRSLCVGMPKSEARIGWKWRALDELARMESGHTPSRRRPEYWGGDIPWIGIRDAKAAHGREISETLEFTNKLGLENSSARLLPGQTVCLSRTASVGYVTVMGRRMATSQDFVNWVCSEKLHPQFLMYLFLAQGEEILKFSSGAVHQTIYFPEAKAFHICLPSVGEQNRIVATLDALREQAQKLEAHYKQRIAALAETKQAILQKAFSGELRSPPPQVVREAAE
jgi:type I restriction enzyme, S subunit